MKLFKNHSLLKLNSFGIDAISDFLIPIQREEDIKEVIQKSYSPIKILGGGSNILLTQNVKGYVLKNEIKGIKIISENNESVIVEVGSGEIWHEFVKWSLENKYAGLENLSLIPGSVGAAPMQNIGAYGIEQEQLFEYLKAVNLSTGELRTFSTAECKFGYRESVFKNELKDIYFITQVCYKLHKNQYFINTEYGAIKEKLEQKGINRPSAKDISDVVIEIRMSKLPDPKVIGNAGSFFKNPVISFQQFEKLNSAYPSIPSYPQENGLIKIPAGWLIEKCGFKGKTSGQIGVHKDQALVLVNYGGGNGSEILKLAMDIKEAVAQNFGIEISPEVNIW